MNAASDIVRRRTSFVLFTLLFILSCTSFAFANDPGHDSLYVLLTGNSNVTGNINLTGNLSAGSLNYVTLLYGQKLDIRANGSVLATSNRPAMQADDTDLYLDPKSGGVLWLNSKGATTNLVQVGPMTGNSVILNVSGSIYQQNVAVCLANGTNCLSGNNTGNISTIAAGNGISVTNPYGPTVTISSNAATCLAGEYSYWSGSAWLCRTDANGGASSGGGWTNTSLTTTTALNVNITNGNFTVVGGNVGIGTASPQSILHLYHTSNSVATFTLENVGSGTSGTFKIITNPDAATVWLTQGMNITSGMNPLNARDSFIGNTEHGGRIGMAVTYGSGAFAIHSLPAGNGQNSIVRMYLDGSNGNVGIGTTATTQKLDVNGSIKANGALMLNTSDGAGMIYIGEGGCSQGYLKFSVDGACIPDLAIDGLGNTNIYNQLNIQTGKSISDGTSGNWNFLLRGTSNETMILNNGNYVYYATQEGKVGINTTNPKQSLDVNGNVNVSGTNAQVWVNGSLVCTAANGLCTGGSASSAGGWTNTSVTTSTALNVNITTGNLTVMLGNVGIGTANPTQRLTVTSTNGLSQDGGMGITNDATSSIGKIWMGDPGNFDGEMKLAVNPIDRNTFGLSVSNSSINFHVPARVSDNFGFGSLSNGYDYYIPNDGSNNGVLSAVQQLRFNTNYTQQMVITDAGNIGVGTNTPGQTLDVRGTALINSSANSGSLQVVNTTGSTHLFVNGSSGNVRVTNKLRVGSDIVDGSPDGIILRRSSMVVGATEGAGIPYENNVLIGSTPKIFLMSAPNYEDSTSSYSRTGLVSYYASSPGVKNVFIGGSVGMSLAGPTSIFFGDSTTDVGLTNGRLSGGNWVFGTVATNIAANGKVHIVGNSSTSALNALYVENQASSPLLVVRNDGAVGIDNAVPTQKLDVNGSANFSGANAQVWVNGSLVCTSANGLCTGGSASSAGGWTNTSVTTSTALNVNITGGNLSVASGGISVGGATVIGSDKGVIPAYIQPSSGPGGNINMYGTLYPVATDTYSIGDPTHYWSTLYSDDAVLKSRLSSTIPLTVSGSAGQTANLQEWRDVGGTKYLWVDNQSRLTYSTINSKLSSAPIEAVTYTSETSGSYANFYSNIYSYNANSGSLSGFSSLVNTGHSSGAMANMDGAFFQVGSGAGAPGSITAMNAIEGFLSNSGTAPITNARAISLAISINGNATVTNAYGAYVGVTGSFGNITNYYGFATGSGYTQLIGTSYGLYIGDVPTATTKYGVYSLAGQNFLRSGNSSEKPLVVRAASGQMADLTEWQNSGGSVLASVNGSGTIFDASGQVCTAANGLCSSGSSSAGGWTNTSTMTSTALNVNLTTGNFTVMTGNVGIGTSTPSSALYVAGTTPQVTIDGTQSSTLRLNGAYGSYVQLEDQSAGQPTLTSSGLLHIKFGGDVNNNYVDFKDQEDTVLMKVDGINDFVGINTSTPGQTLDVRGTAIINSSANTGSFQVVNGTGSTQFFVNGNTGDIGVGMINPSHRLHIPWLSGDAVSTSYFGSSDTNNNQHAIEAYSYTGNTIFSQSDSGSGVWGSSVSGAGLFGTSTSGSGVAGRTFGSGVGVYADSYGAGTAIVAIAGGGDAFSAQAVSGYGVNAKTRDGTAGLFWQYGALNSTITAPTGYISRSLTLGGFDATGAILKVEDTTVSSGHLAEFVKQGSIVSYLNSSGSLFIEGANRVCTAANGLCSGAGTSSAGGWMNDSQNTTTALNVIIGTTTTGIKLRNSGDSYLYFEKTNGLSPGLIVGQTLINYQQGSFNLLSNGVSGNAGQYLFSTGGGDSPTGGIVQESPGILRITNGSVGMGSLNASALYENGSRVCTAANGICSSGSSSGGGWTNTSNTVMLANNNTNVSIGSTPLALFDNTNGRVIFGGGSLSNSPGILNVIKYGGDIGVRSAITSYRTDSAASVYGVYSNVVISASSDSVTHYFGVQGEAVPVTANVNTHGMIVGVSGTAFGVDYAAKTSDMVYGGLFSAQSGGSGSTVTKSASIYSSHYTYASATTTNHYGLYVENGVGPGTLQNQYGVYVENMSSGTNSNYAFYAAGGKSVFNAGSSIVVPIGIRAATGQTANLTEWRDGSDAVLASINGTGAMFIAGSQVCTAANGLCSTGGSSSAAGWTNTSTTTSTALNVNASNFLFVNGSAAGLGTANPRGLFDIFGSTYSMFFSVNGLQLDSANLRLSNNYGILIGDSGGTKRDAFYADVSNNLVVGSKSYAWNSIGLYAGSTSPSLYLDSSGNVGINDTAPTTMLSVKSSSPNGALHIQGGAGTSLFFVNGSSGNVGIGTKNPNAVLHIQTNSSAGLYSFFETTYSAHGGLRTYLNGDAASAWITQGAAITSNYQAISPINTFTGDTDHPGRIGVVLSFGSGQFSLQSLPAGTGTTSIIRLYMDQSGSFGIGTSAPTQKLDVNGSANFSGEGAQVWVNGSLVCTASNGLCGSGGNVSGSGAAGTLAKWTGTGTIGNSIVSESSGTLTVNGNISMPISFWLGNSAVSNATNSLAIGTNAQAVANYGTAVGSDSFALDYASAFGPSARANSTGAVAIGNGALANGTNNLAVGYDAQASGVNGATAVGISAYAQGYLSTAIGKSALATGSSAIAISGSALGDSDIAILGNAASGNGIAMGSGSNVTGIYSAALGSLAKATAQYTTAVGGFANANAQFGTAIGNGAIAGNAASALGASATATGSVALALGYTANASNGDSIAIGRQANARNSESVALGPYSQTLADNEFMVGASGHLLNTYVWGTLNTTGNLYENNNRVCTAANGLCATTAYQSSAAGWTNTTTTTGTALNVNLTTGNLTVMNGNVGIGTGSPVNALDVAVGADNQGITIRRSTNWGWWDIRTVSSSGPGTLYFSSGNSGWVPLEFDGANNVVKLSPYGGNVGIGTSSPGYKLEVNGTLGVGTAGAGGQITFPTTTSGFVPYISSQYANNRLELGIANVSYMRFDGSGSSVLNATLSINSFNGNPGLIVNQGNIAWPTIADFQVSGASKMIILSNGNVGIGTDSPGAKLHVRNGSSGVAGLPANAATIIESSTHNYLYMLAPDVSASGVFFGNPTSAYSGGVLYNYAISNGLNFVTNGTTQLYLTNTGAMGLGTNTPQSTFDVEGNAAIGSAYSGAIAAPSNGLIVEGNVGIGTATPAAALEIGSGQILAPNGSQSLPSYSFSSAPNAGFYWDGTNLNYAVSGQRVAYINTADASFPAITINGRSRFVSTSDGNITATNNANNGFSYLQFGGTTSAQIAIKTILPSKTFALRLADDSGDANLTAGNALFNGNVGIGTTNPTSKLYVNSSGESIAVFTNSHTNGTGSLNKLFIGMGEGGTYTNGYGVIGGLNGSDSITTFLKFENFVGGSAGIGAYQDLQFLNNKGLWGASSDVGASVALLVFDSSNNLNVGPRYGRQYGTNFYIGNSSAAYTWNVHSGAELMRLTGSGNVGIGTTNPTATLQVGGAILSNASVWVTNSSNSGAIALWQYSNDGILQATRTLRMVSSGVFAFESAINTVLVQIDKNGGTAGSMAVGSSWTGEAALTVYGSNSGLPTAVLRAAASQSNDTFQVQSSGGTKLAYINASGSIFDSSGQVCTASNGLCATAATYQSSAAGWTNSSTMVMLANNATNLSVGWNGADAPLLFMDNAHGRLGIGGVSTPLNTLDVRGNMDLYTNGPSLRMIDAGSGDTYIRVPAGTKRLEIANGTTTQFALDQATGNLGIGVTTPTQKLEVAGNILLNTSNNSVNYIQVPWGQALGLTAGAEGHPEYGVLTTKYSVKGGGYVQIDYGGAGVYQYDTYGGMLHMGYGGVWLYNGGGYLGGWNLTLESVRSVIIKSNDYTVMTGGNVGIGTYRPTQKLDVNGSINVSGPGNIYYQGNLSGYGADLAEYVFGTNVDAGDVVILSPTKDKTVEKADVRYDSRVAGIVSTRPSQMMSADEGNVLLALAGRVPVKVTTENGPIKRGDLLTTSSTPGRAMRCESRTACTGAIVGKAMESFSGQEGKITALVVLG